MNINRVFTSVISNCCVDESESVCIFIISGGHPTILLQPMEKTLYNVATFYKRLFIIKPIRNCGSCEDHRQPLLGQQSFPAAHQRHKRHRVLARVAGHQRRGLGHIMTRTCRQGKTQREKRIIHRRWSFVVKPPQLRPSALIADRRFFWSTCCRSMGPHNR